LLDIHALLIDLGLDESYQVSQRFLPIYIASLGWNDVQQTYLRDFHLGADLFFLQRHRHLHLAGPVGIVLVHPPEVAEGTVQPIRPRMHSERRNVWFL
jgi:hypothetical protein